MHRSDHLLVVDRREYHDARLIIQRLLDLRGLLIDIVRLLGDEVDDPRIRGLGDLVDTDAEIVIGWVCEVLGENRDRRLLLRCIWRGTPEQSR